MAQTRFSLAFLLLSTSLATGQPTCPTAEDVETGVVLVQRDPFQSHLMIRDEGVLTLARIVDGEVQNVSIIYDHALAEAGQIDSGGLVGMEYAEDVAALDRLNEIRLWTSAVDVVINGIVENSGSHHVQFLGETERSLGDCTYEAWRVRTEIRLDGRNPLRQELFFAPSLGISLGTVYLDANGTPTSNLIYDQIEAR